MIIRNKDFSGDTYVMGILNATPDSFSDGGKWNNIDKALYHAEKMINEGASVLDIGGESTRPGYEKISDEAEIERVVPIISAIRSRFDVPISVDTYKSSVAEAAILAGADMVNDIWGFRYDAKMADIVKKHNVACCLMHNRADATYTDFAHEVVSDLNESVKIAKAHNIADDKIILDPGIGFAKTVKENLWLTGNLDILKELNYPVLLGTSRKSMIGLTLDLPVNERLEGTLVTTVFAVQQGCLFVRVHDVLENIRAIKMTKALMQGE